MMPSTPAADIFDDRGIRRVGYLILLAVFGGFGGWACLAPLDSAALAPGVVTVKSYRKTVQHLEGGIVSELHARDGDVVRQGDILLNLDVTQLQAELEVLRNQQIATAALEARLLAELQNQDDLAIPADTSTKPRAHEAWQTEQALFRARRQAHAGETQILEQTVAQLQAQIRGLEAVIRSKRQLEQSHREEANDLQALLSEGFTDKQRLREQERNLSRLSGEIADHLAAISQAQQRSSEAHLQILQLQKNLTNEITTQLAEVQTQAFDTRERLRGLEDRLERSAIRAPASGMILGLKVHTLGAVLGAGQPILEIVPENADLIIEAHISPNDIDRIAPGKKADVRFSAFNSATTPVIEGVLEQISADRIVDEKTGQPYYLGKVAITAKGLHDLGLQTLLPGMPAEVLINTGSRTLLSYLLQPASNWMARSLTED